MALILAAAHYQQLVDHARAGLPNEVCGLIGGWRETANLILPLPNIAATPSHRYRVDPTAFVSAYRQIEQAGGELLAIYHSHPVGLPIPSAVDIAEASWSTVGYVIIGFSESIPQLQAWSIRRGVVTAVQLQIR